MRIWTHSNKDKGCWRGWFHLVDKNEHDLFDTAFTVSWGKAYRFAGAKLHFGDKGSETPIDWHIGLWWIAFYGSVSADWLRSFAAWIGGGHKRDLMLEIHGDHGQYDLVWRLWWDDDGGHDRTIHDCDKWRRPMLPPWRWGRKKYRSWMCLRNGRIDLNPLDAIWGSRFYDYVTVEEDVLLIEVNQFPGDEYMVQFELQEVWRQRRHGPKLWVRRRSFHGLTASWEVEGSGIPTRNHSWKGNGILASSVKVKTREGWRLEADLALVDFVKKDRERNGYYPPVGRVLSAEVKEDGLYITGEVWNDVTKAAIFKNSLKHLSLGFDTTDKGMTMAAAQISEDGEIDIATEYVEFETNEDDLKMEQPFTMSGTIPFEGGPDQIFTEQAKQQLADGLAGFPITQDQVRTINDLTIQEVSINDKPNVFGEGLRLTGVDWEGETEFKMSDSQSWSVPVVYSEINHELLDDVIDALKSTDEKDKLRIQGAINEVRKEDQ